MSNPGLRLSVLSRQLPARRVPDQGWPAAHVAEQPGISRATAHEWVRRYRAEGEAGLLDRSSRPHRSPRRTGAELEAEILAARAGWRYGPDRLGPLLGLPPSTVHRVLRRRGLSRLRDADRVTAAPVRYAACHPGALPHQDHKRLGRIPDGGGWRGLGRLRAPHQTIPGATPATSTSGSSSTTPPGTPSSCRCPARPRRAPCTPLRPTPRGAGTRSTTVTSTTHSHPTRARSTTPYSKGREGAQAGSPRELATRRDDGAQVPARVRGSVPASRP